MEYLLSRNCPRNRLLVNAALGRAEFYNHPWAGCRDTFVVAVKHGLISRDDVSDLMRRAEDHGDSAFLDMARSYGYIIIEQ